MIRVAVSAIQTEREHDIWTEGAEKTFDLILQLGSIDLWQRSI